MNRPRRFGRLVGWIRLIPSGDGYGVAIYRGSGNPLLTAETDGGLIIIAFHDFYNIEEYEISFEIPSDYVERRFSIGDSVPIPFVVDGRVGVVLGNTQPASLSSRLMSFDNPVVHSLEGILRGASDGSSRVRLGEALAAPFRAEYDDVLGGEPAHSRLWVQRLTSASTAIKQLKPDGVEAARVFLKNSTEEWLKRFSSKGEIKLLAKILDVASSAEVISAQQIRDTLVKISLAKLVSGLKTNQKELDHEFVMLANRYIVRGLYDYYLRNGVPSGSSKIEMAAAQELPSILLSMINQARGAGSLRRAYLLSCLLFAKEDLPSSISSVIGSMAMTYRTNLMSKMAMLFTSHSSDGEASSRSSKARQVLNETDTLVIINRILHGPLRLSETIPPATQMVWTGMRQDVRATIEKMAGPRAHRRSG